MTTNYSLVWDAYTKALRTNDASDWKLYICLSDLYNNQEGQS